MRPSASAVMAEQKMSRISVWFSRGTAVNVPATGSHTVGETAPRQSGPPSHRRILPLSSRTMFIGTMGIPLTGLLGMLITAPNTPPLAVCTVTLLPAVLPLGSVAVAVIVWVPSAREVLSQLYW